MYKNYLLTIVLLLFAANVQAKWYQVEVILFEYLHLDADGEVWDTNPGLPDNSNSIDLIADVPNADAAGNAGALIAFQVLPRKGQKLAGVYSILKRSGEYRPLAHVAWQQPALTRARARQVHIKVGEGAMLEQGTEIPLLKIDGSIKVRSGHFLHVDVDLAYFLNSLPESMLESLPLMEAGEQGYEYTRMLESRRIKLNEIHYFDHPLFGMLLRVNRLGQ